MRSVGNGANADKISNMVVVTHEEHTRMHSKKCAECVCKSCERCTTCRCQLCGVDTDAKLYCREQVSIH